MIDANIQELNLRFLRFLRDNENKELSFNDINQIFNNEEVITLLTNSTFSSKITSLLKNTDLLPDFQQLIDERLTPMLDNEYYGEYLSLISDDIILERLKESTYNDVVEACIDCLKTDESRLKALEIKSVKKDVYHVTKVVSQLEDDNLKMKYLRIVDKTRYGEVFDTIKDEKLKEMVIKKYPNETSRLISHLEDEKMRIYYYERYFKKLDQYSKREIYSSFSEESKERYLDRYWKYLSTEEKTIQLAMIENKEIILSRAQSLSDIEKIFLIHRLEHTNPELISEIANTIEYNNSTKMFKQIPPHVLRETIQWLDVEKILGHMTDDKKIQYIKGHFFNTEDLLIVLSTVQDISKTEILINHHNDFPEYDPKYDNYIARYADFCNVEPKRLIKMVQIFGIDILKNAKSEQIQKVMQLDDIAFEKVMRLYEPSKYQMDNATLNDNINIYLQRKFKLENPQIINISSHIRLSIESGQNEEALSTMNKIISEYDISAILGKHGYTTEQFMNGLFTKGELDEKVTSCLLEITNGYIVFKRNEFIQENINDCYSIFAEESYEPKSASKFVVENYPISIMKDALFNPRRVLEKNGYSKEEIEFVNHPTALESIINFKRNPSAFQTMPEDAKKYMRIFNKMLEDSINDRFNLTGFRVDGKKVYTPNDEINYQMLRDSFFSLDFEQLQNGILSNDEAYEQLSSTLEKYKLFGFTDTMSGSFAMADLDASGYTIANMINYYPVIYKELSEKLNNGEIKNITLPAILDMAECYGADTNKLSMLFGKVNTRLLSSNPGPNSSTMPREERLERAQEYLHIMNERTTVTVPPFDQDFELSNGKKINIVVGNVSDPINLTYGERTGACMRIGGHADSLFDFCLTNENGFHIRFSNPENDNFVSRVSGFRNGNTVFLNELRYTTDVKYTNNDVKEACILAAKALIESSKTSDHPIENVVIAPAYVLLNEPGISLGVSDIKSGFENFYSDVTQDRAVVLATTNPDNTLVPVKLDSNSVTRYPTQRGKIKMYAGESSYEALSRIEMLDQVLSGVSIEDVIITPKNDVSIAYCGDDWYVTVDSQGKISEYMMNSSNKKQQASIEKSQCIAGITAQLGFATLDSTVQINNNVGGVKK